MKTKTTPPKTSKKIALFYNKFIRENYKSSGYLIFNINDGTGGYWADTVNNIKIGENLIALRVANKRTPITIEEVDEFIKLKKK